MVFNKNKKAQAAIEFLMTYGWMLLVVLIVGALIFSFVDFGSLLPNKVDLSNNLRASATESLATVGNTSSKSDDEVIVVFSYNGAKAAKIDVLGAKLTTDLNENCPASIIMNLNLNTNSSLNGTGSTSTGPITFLNGHDGVVKFDCVGLQTGMIENDVISGFIQINVQNAKTKIEVPSKGQFRLQITSN